MEVESMKKLKVAVEKCIDELSKKSDLTPAETKAALDGMMLREKLCEAIEDGQMNEEYSERGYSRRRSYSGNSMRGSYDGYSSGPMYGVRGWYQNSMNGYSGYPGYPSEHMRMSYCPPYEEPYYSDGYSERRGGNYSRHSIGDKAVERLENLMDQAGSDYEKEELHKFIRMIKAAVAEG